MPRLPWAVALLTALPLSLAACSAGDSGAEPDPDATSTTPTPSPSASDEPTPSRSPDEGGSGRPDRLDWQQVPGPVDDQVTVSGKWSLTLAAGGKAVSLAGPDRQQYDAPRGYHFTEALIDGQYAVVLAEHEQATKPNVLSVYDLAHGGTTEADVPAGVGGSWALGSGLLAGTASHGRDYCITVVDLLADRGSRGPCVPPRHGISNLRISPAGIAAMTFDDSRPSCRTLNRVEGSSFEPLPGVSECRGWEAVVTESSTIWGEVTNERRVEEAEYFIDSGGGRVDLGVGTTGTLTWCGGAAYLVRDPQRKSDPARLLRVTPDGTEVVYESPGHGNAFLAAPRCGGTDLTVTAFSAAGDEQVTASLR